MLLAGQNIVRKRFEGLYNRCSGNVSWCRGEVTSPLNHETLPEHPLYGNHGRRIKQIGLEEAMYAE